MILEIEDLAKSYGKKKVLKDIDLTLKEGEIVGLVGPNGSGKTTLIKCVLGLLRRNKGTIKIDGYDTSKNFSKAIFRVGAIIENPASYMYLSAYDNLKLVCNYYDIKNKDEKIKELAKYVGLENRLKDKVSKYSLGMRQRLGLAMALVNDPKLLLLDEPTNGLDPEGMVELRNLLKKLAREKNTTVVISSHNLSEIEKTCDKVVFLKNGVLVNANLMNKELGKYILTLNTNKDIKENNNLRKIGIDKLEFTGSKEEVASLVSKLVKDNYKLYSLVENEDLEEKFLKEVGGNPIV